MLPARPPPRPPASITSRWAISGAPVAQERSQPPLRFGRCRPGHPLACPPPGVSLEAGLPGHVRAEGTRVGCWPSSSWREDSPRPGRPRRVWAGRPPGASAGDHAALPAPRRPWLGPAGTSSRSVMGWCCSRRGVQSLPTQVCVENTRAIETVCAQTCSPSADTRPVTSVFCSFLIKTLPRPCFPINLLVVSKYVRTPSLVKSGFE